MDKREENNWVYSDETKKWYAPNEIMPYRDDLGVRCIHCGMNYEIIIERLKNVDKTLIPEEIIFEDLSSLWQQVNNEKTMNQILKKIHFLIKNIIQNPEKEQFKRINIHKFLSQYNFPMIETFFLHIHFQKKDEYIYYRGDYDYINSVMLELIKFKEDNKLDINLDNKEENNRDIKKIDEKDNKSNNKKDNKIIDELDNRNNNISNNSMCNEIDDAKVKIMNSKKTDNKTEKPIIDIMDAIKNTKTNNLSSEHNQNFISHSEETKLLNGSTLVDDSQNIKLYIYPKITFNTEEEDNSKVILLIGQTGEGKTTFLNAFVNIYSGIKIEDNFRYLLVKDQKQSDQRNSKTKSVTIYNIRPKKGLNFPPIKIVDTPGFGDTKGFDEDKKHLEQLKKAFDKNLNVVHSICFIVNSTKCRIDFHQEYVFNTLIGLFAENVKDIFIVGVTHFFPDSSDDIPNIIKYSLSLKDSFYYKCILEGIDISNTYWYFASDNGIITNNRIKRNSTQIDKWNQTEKEIIFYIENKIKNSQEVKIKETKEVIENRINVISQIDALEKKIKELFDIRRLLKESKKKEEEYLKEIKDKEEIIQKHQEEKKNAENNMETIAVNAETIINEEELNKMANQYNLEGNYIDMIDNITESLKDFKKRKIKS